MKKIFLLTIILTTNLFSSDNTILWGLNIEGFPIKESFVKDFKKQIPINTQIYNFYLAWPSFDISMNRKELLETFHSINSQNALISITWEPRYFIKYNPKNIYYKDILEGKYDNYIDSFAKAIKEWEKPILIRFAHEMNLKVYHWGTDEKDYNKKSPEIYKSIYQYVVNRLKKNKVANVLWIFCPNNESIPNKNWNTIKDYYPGDDYVDILGIDGYNWGTSRTFFKNGWKSYWQSFYSIFKSAYYEIKKIAPEKPIIICETASVNENNERLQWMQEAIKTAKDWNVKAIIYFQIDKEINWKLTYKEAEKIASNFKNSLSNKDIIKELIDEKERSNK